MSMRSKHPVSAEQVSATLATLGPELGPEPLFDPQLQPQGPQDEDRRQLLGALMATAELEITAATQLGHDDTRLSRQSRRHNPGTGTTRCHHIRRTVEQFAEARPRQAYPHGCGTLARLHRAAGSPASASGIGGPTPVDP